MYPEEAVASGNQNCRTNTGDNLPSTVVLAIDRLVDARRFAIETKRDIWEFAIPVTELRRAGVVENELRWLVCRGYIEHATEQATTGRMRLFDRDVSLRFCNRTAFAITDAGVAFSAERSASKDCQKHSAIAAASPAGTVVTLPRMELVENGRTDGNGVIPKWDMDRRELRLGGKLVKVFKLPSPMQEAILMAFEEERWPPRIDDPLPMNPELLPKRRLLDTVKSLNRNQKSCLIRFMGDGTGEGVRWERISSDDGH